MAQAKDELEKRGIHNDNIKDKIVAGIVKRSEAIYQQCVTLLNPSYNSRDRKIDKILTSKSTGIPIMLLLLGLIFWITIVGANYPSDLLSSLFSWLEEQLGAFMVWIHSPQWLQDLLLAGIFRTTAWVVSVMLPPMAIFFPLFTLLEDVGYLPRIAFNMDKFFRKANAHGKQALSMCMEKFMLPNGLRLIFTVCFFVLKTQSLQQNYQMAKEAVFTFIYVYECCTGNYINFKKGRIYGIILRILFF